MKRRISPRGRWLAAVPLALFAIALLAGSASAKTTNVYRSQIDTSAAGNPFFVESLATDGSGDLFAGNVGALLVDKFDPSGAYLSQFDGSGTPPGSFYPSALAIAPNGNVYVGDGFGAGIFKLDSAGGYLAQLTGANTPQGYLFAAGLTTDPAENLYVSDGSNNVVDKFDSSGAYLSQFDGSGTPQGSFAPHGIVRDGAGNLYVIDANAGVIDKFDSSGAYLSQFDGSGTPAGSFAPTSIAISGADIYVSDVANGVVDRFDPSGAYLSQFDGASVPGPFFPGQIATNAAGNVFVFNATAGTLLRFSPPVVVPDVATGEATGADQSGAPRLEGSVNPAGIELEECAFEYGTAVSYGQTVPCAETPAEIGAGEAAVPVHADLSGLPVAVYHFRLVAGNGNGTVRGGDRTFTIPGVPDVLSGEAEATSTEANLKASVNPNSGQTTYHFEYGPTSAYGSRTADAAIPSGTAPVAVKAHIQNLRAGATYHFRVVAGNGYGDAQGPDQTFTTTAQVPADDCPNAGIRQMQGQTALPDCRAYEQVTPIEKGTAAIGAIGFQARPDGGGLLFTADSSINSPQTESATREARYLSIREGDGWGLRQVDVPAMTEPLFDYFSTLAISDDLSRVFVVSNRVLTPGGIEGGVNLYLRDTDSGALTLVGASPGGEAFRQFAGLGNDERFLGGSSDFSTVVFDSPAPMTPDATPGVMNVYQWSEGAGLKLVSIMPDGSPATVVSATRPVYQPELHLTSADGSKVLFGLLYGEGEGVYARLGGETTIPLSVSQIPGDPATVHPGNALWVSKDGEVALFTSLDSTPLAAGAPAQVGDIYSYDFGTGKLRYLASTGSGGQEALLAASEDASYVYFFAGGSYYLAHGGTVKTVANVSFQILERNVSPSGRYLAFGSTRRLTGYDNEERQEVYVYDAEVEELSCASCPADGARSTGDALLPQQRQEQGSNHIPKAVTDGGEVFFDTPSRLTGRDVNGLRDVYSYRDGAVQLLSPGNDNFGATFIDAGASGDDVFIKTSQSLVHQDDDNLYDIYDARVDGGMPGQNQLPAPRCSGESCRGPAGLAPTAPALGSAAMNAGGNVQSRHRKRCRKGRDHAGSHRKARCPSAKHKQRAGAKSSHKHTTGGRGR